MWLLLAACGSAPPVVVSTPEPEESPAPPIESSDPHIRFVEARVQRAEAESGLAVASHPDNADLQHLREQAAGTPSAVACLEIQRRFHRAALHLFELRLQLPDATIEPGVLRRAEVREAAYREQAEHLCTRPSAQERCRSAGAASASAHVNMVDLEAQIATLSVVYGERHPTLIEARTRYASLRERLGERAPEEAVVCPEVGRLLEQAEQDLAVEHTRYGPSHPTIRQAVLRRDIIQNRWQTWCQSAAEPSSGD